MRVITEVEYLGKKYEAETTIELIKKLRYEVKLSQPKIAKLLGFSRERVSQLLGRDGRIEYSQLDEPNIFIENTDEEIASNLNLPLSKISTARRKLGIKRKENLSPDKRRKELCLFLFNCSPGPKFLLFISEILRDLPESTANTLRKFYILATEENSTNSERVKRWACRRDLKGLVSCFNVKELVEKEVIENCLKEER